MKESDSKKRQITVSEMAPHVHNFYYGENKVDKLTSWLAGWIKKALESKKIKPYDFLPSKGDLAFHIGVSLGTMQNVFRLVEDMGLIESKQKIGTYVLDTNMSKKSEKLTSKREMACELIKNYIISEKYKIGDKISSIRTVSVKTNISSSTARVAFNKLLQEGILEKKGQKFYISSLDFEINNIKNETLAEKIAKQIKSSINNNLTRLPSNIELSKKYKVSVKTIHDALKILAKEGFVSAKRGKYGTVVLNNDTKQTQYLYEMTEQKIKKYITENCKINEKIPTIKEFSNIYNVSVKTIKKALDNLESDGYIRFMRGRYGGTFLIDYPSSHENYTWLAINPNFI